MIKYLTSKSEEERVACLESGDCFRGWDVEQAIFEFYSENVFGPIILEELKIKLESKLILLNFKTDLKMDLDNNCLIAKISFQKKSGEHTTYKFEIL